MICVFTTSTEQNATQTIAKNVLVVYLSTIISGFIQELSMAKNFLE